MSPRFILGRENVPCVAEVVNRSLKADCTDYTDFTQQFLTFPCVPCVKMKETDDVLPVNPKSTGLFSPGVALERWGGGGGCFPPHL